jgi:hypothetical protein
MDGIMNYPPSISSTMPSVLATRHLSISIAYKPGVKFVQTFVKNLNKYAKEQTNKHAKGEIRDLKIINLVIFA